jgi:glutathione S-transferase
MELGSNVLNAIAALYNAPTEMALDHCVQTLRDRFARVETALGDGPFFAGARFSLVDAAFAPVLRYFDALERLGVDVLDGLAKVEAWRAALARRASVRTAVGSDYGERLLDFIADYEASVSYTEAQRSLVPRPNRARGRWHPDRNVPPLPRR